MKYVVCVPDGCADLPVPELDGKTSLEASVTPVLDELAKRGRLGRARVIPEGMPPGSDVGTMSIFGYDPSQFHTGRAPIEAAAMGIKLVPGQLAFRCNLVTIDPKAETMLDFSGGHPENLPAAAAIDALNQEFGGEKNNGKIQFYPGVQYRHIMVVTAESEEEERALAELKCIPPHDISEKSLVWPDLPWLVDIMKESREILAGIEGLSANQIWLWGQGTQPQLPHFSDLYKKQAGLVTAVDLVRGLGALTGMNVVNVPGATAWYDTDYSAKRDAVLKGLQDGADLFILHVEASDEAGHAGDVEEKVKCLENWDSKILEGLISQLDLMDDWRLLLMPDHATPLTLKTHTSDPVPYLLVDSKNTKNNGKMAGEESAVFTEEYVKDLPIVDAHLLMSELLS